MDVWLWALWLVDRCYGCSGEDHDGYVLRDSRFSVVWEEARIWVAEGIVDGIGIVEGERCGVRVWSSRYDGCRGPRGGKVVCYDSQREQRNIVFLRQADGGGGRREGGAESAVEGCERYAEINSIIVNGRLDSVGFEDRVLIAPSQRGALWRGRLVVVRLTMARTLDRSQAISHVSQVAGRRTYAQTWLPCSGTTVNRSCSLLSWSQTSLPSDERDAVRPEERGVSGTSRSWRLSRLTGESIDVLD